MKLVEITNQMNFSNLLGKLDIVINKIQYDSRKITKGDLFVAIKGEASDGHDFINSAIEKGAIAIVCEDFNPIYKDIEHITFIIVNDSRKALAEMAAAYYNFPSSKLKLIGITGTNGKTTCTFLIAKLLQAIGKNVAIIGTTGIYYNNKKIEATHTTPESLELHELFASFLSEGIEYVVMEVSSHSLVLNRVYGIDFKVAVFTNLSQDHLDFHKTMDEYAKAKKILFNNLELSSYSVIFGDNSYSKLMVKDTLSKVINVGYEKYNDVVINSYELNSTNSKFNLIIKNNETSIVSNLIGKFNIENLALSFIACSCLGFDVEHLAKLTKLINGAEGRMERYILKSGAIAVIDYAHTPDALEKALLSCKEVLNSGNKLISIFGCGGNRDTKKRAIMGRISSDLADTTVITNDNPRNESPTTIIQDIISGIIHNKHYIIIEDRKLAIHKAVELAKEGDIILLAGKGHENYQVIGNEKLHFSDKEEISKFL